MGLRNVPELPRSTTPRHNHDAPLLSRQPTPIGSVLRTDLLFACRHLRFPDP